MDSDLASLSIEIGDALRQRRLILASAESCTGGWAAQVVTHTAGSSAWFDRGFITYTNDAKVAMLGVRPETALAKAAGLALAYRTQVDPRLNCEQALEMVMRIARRIGPPPA